MVVFVHGYQASARVWHGVQQALPAQQYRSIAINNRGAGASEAPPNESDFTIQKFAADAFELVSLLKLERFTLVGHSMGGATVAQFAVDHPDRVSGLVLLDPASPNGAAMEPAQLEAFLDQRMVLRREQQARGAGGDGIDARGTDFDPEQLRLLMQDTAAAPERRLRGSMRSITFTSKTSSETVTVPLAFLLSIPVFKGGDPWQVPCRLSYRPVTKGDIRVFEWKIEMWQPNETIKACLADMGETVKARTKLPFFFGAPE